MLPLPFAVANDTATRLLARVKELREARGLSQEAFAEKAGLGYKYYQHVESGRRRDIRLSTLEKLADPDDANGDGIVNATDRTLTSRAVGRQLTGGKTLDD